ncbi:bis(5'-adenosyl)-triphosphatase, partial [[Emmonsia] crescens]
PPNQVFYVTPLSFALVNLKPLLPGHVLVCPLRCVPRVTDLSLSETTDLFLTVRRVSRMIERVYRGTSLNIAIQDGPEAGQTVPHVHAHIIPRRKADLEHRGGSDAIYEMMEGREGNIARHLGEMVEEKREKEREKEREESSFPGVDNEGREPRSEEEMMEEAFALAKEMEGEPAD